MPETAEIYLQPGEWKLVREPAILKTVLGSCVGITFRAPRLGISAMCHPMLPCYAARPGADPSRLVVGRYVDSVIEQIANKFAGQDAQPGEIEVKLFGGADVLASSRKNATVGKMNGVTALEVLERLGFRPVVSRLGGSQGVFIEFHTATGEVLLRRLNNMDAVALART
ncbi:MAG TPA: chemotaxis protein CheD [Terracidiphilus sp.]|nr:chemotaxis protein CheD [Terracidiphilus sp.]